MTDKKELPNLHKVILLLVTSRDKEHVRKTCCDKLNLTAEQTDELIDQAESKIVLAADYDRKALIGEAVIRYDDCYNLARKKQCVRDGIAAEDKKCKLLGLYPESKEAHDAGQEQENNEELEQIRSYLLPLELAKKETPTVELVRLAVIKLQNADKQKHNRLSKEETRLGASKRGKVESGTRHLPAAGGKKLEKKK
ncbi:MAG: hypothetical protein LBT05_10570 [Planctomycetaceae bacterium]|nr:hypothetical protein [Planctomycetaceae bacterium]